MLGHQERRSDMAHYGGVYMKKKGGKSAQSNGPGSKSFGPALSTAESKTKKGKKR